MRDSTINVSFKFDPLPMRLAWARLGIKLRLMMEGKRMDARTRYYLRRRLARIERRIGTRR